MRTSDHETFFGFKKVAFADKAKLVGEVFSSVASKYDVMNDMMSLGIHRFWKKSFVDLIPCGNNIKILDVAGGTGDISIRYHQKAKKAGYQPDITICDINAEMLSIGRDKAINSNILYGLDSVQGDAEHLPFADNIFDCYVIAFGIRNVTNIDAALKESYRVLRPGGKFLCLEFSKLESTIIQKFYDIYSFHVIPRIGECIAGNYDAYQYLVESIEQFPNQESFGKMIENAGYKAMHYTNLTSGIAAIHMAHKPC